MNRDEARFILRAYRVGGQDALDPQFREALELLKRDPELAEWFAQEQSIDRCLADKLQAFPVPPELKTHLLAARKIVRPKSWWRGPARALAASIVFFLVAAGGLWSLHTYRQARMAEFQTNMLTAATTAEPHVQAMNLNLAGVRDWLTKQGADTNIDLPQGLKLTEQTRLGCRVLQWRGHKVSLLCFQLDGGRHVDMFVINAEGVAGVSSSPKFATVNAMNTATWRHDRKVYLMASQVSKSDLKRLL